MNVLYPKKIASIFSYLSSLLDDELFLVGGSTRDLLLGREVSDLDFATRKKPDEVHDLFPDKLYFEKYGTTTFKIDTYHITLATYREEKDYIDFRHPSKVEFVTDYKTDSKRRDFTINCLYATLNGEVMDPTNQGIDDLSKKIIRIIGNPKTRLNEDPLRILRAYRFKEELGFTIEEHLKKELKESECLLKNLNSNKIMEEIRKFPKDIQDEYIDAYLPKEEDKEI